MPYHGGTPMAADPSMLMDRLMKNGYSRAQAAAIMGNLQRESGLASNSVNKDEQAYGLMQWRGDRFTALQQFAAARKVPWTDPATQADFIAHEMRTTENRNAQGFLAARNVDEASAALKPVIRYGDKSGPERAMHAREFFTAGSDPVNVKYGDVQPVRGRGGPDGQVLPSLPSGLYAPVAPVASAVGGGAAQGQLPQLRPRLPEAGEADETTLPSMRRSQLTNASPGLQQAPGRSVDLSGASSYAAPQRSTGNIGLRGGISSLGDLGAAMITPRQRPGEQAPMTGLQRLGAAFDRNSSFPQQAPAAPTASPPVDRGALAATVVGQPPAVDMTSHNPVAAAPPGAPEPPRFPGGVPQPRSRPMTGPGMMEGDVIEQRDALASLVDPRTGFDYG